MATNTAKDTALRRGQGDHMASQRCVFSGLNGVFFRQKREDLVDCPFGH